MAGRINAAGESFRRTANLPSRTAFTIAGWGYRHTAQSGAYRYFAGLEDATSNSSGYLLLGWRENASMGLDSDGGGASFASSLAEGIWFYWFIRSNGANSYQAGYKPLGGSWTTVTLAAALNWTPAMLTLGNDSYDEWTDISLERVRVWDATLTNTELDSELASGTPVRTSSLRANWPLVSDTSDTVSSYSLTAVGAVSYEAGPPGMGESGVAGSASLALGGLTVSGSGALAVSGSANLALGGLGLVAAGTAAGGGAGGSANISLGAVAVAAAGAVDVRASAAIGLGGATAAASGAAAVAGAAILALGAVSVAANGYRLSGACAGGVLQVDPVNGRYFRNDSGPLVLSGFHTWASIQDSWPSLPVTPLDFDAYLAALVSYGCNFTKAWFLESAKDWGDSVQYFSPHPWPRTGPGSAADGLSKFDLSQFNEGYFARLRERCIRLGNAGIYVCVQLFQGWHVAQKGYTTGNPWAYHPFAAGNNVNGIDGDTNNDGSGYETRSTSFTAVYNLQKAYVEKVLDTLNDLDNIFYEIANEEDSSSLAWQRALAAHIRSYEAGKAKQHPVGMTVCWPGGDNAALYASDVDWLSPNGDLTPDAAAGTKVVAYDTDHLVGLTSEHKWVFRSFCQGMNPWYMDEWAGETYGADRRGNATYQRIRANLGKVVAYAARFDLSAATPQGDLCSTGYCLAQTTGVARLLAYQDGSGAFTVNLSGLTGTFAVEWLRTAAAAPTVQAGGSVNGGAVRTLTPPWAGEDAVALLELAGTEGAAVLTLGLLSVAAAAVVAIQGQGGVALSALALAGSGASAVAGTAQAALPVVTLDAQGVAGEQPAFASAEITLDPLAVQAAGAVAVAGAASLTVGAISVVASGVGVELPDISGGANISLNAITVTAAGFVALIAVLGRITGPGGSGVAPGPRADAAIGV